MSLLSRALCLSGKTRNFAAFAWQSVNTPTSLTTSRKEINELTVIIAYLEHRCFKAEGPRGPSSLKPGRSLSSLGSDGGSLLTLSVHPDEIPEELMRDFVGARYGCALVQIQDDESPTPYNNRVQQAAILCKQETFWKFMVVSSAEEEAARAPVRLPWHWSHALNSMATKSRRKGLLRWLNDMRP
jgi:hypothetical protein